MVIVNTVVLVQGAFGLRPAQMALALALAPTAGARWLRHSPCRVYWSASATGR